MKHSELRSDLGPDQILERLRGTVTADRGVAAVTGDLREGSYAGLVDGSSFRIRVTHRMPQFYATYLCGNVEVRSGQSMITFHFGRRAPATFALWVIRVLGGLLILGSLLAGMRQRVALVALVLVAFGVGLLLWLYRLRSDDMERLRTLVTRAAAL